MNAIELKQMKNYATLILSLADNEEWEQDDGTRILANLALKAAQELPELLEVLSDLLGWANIQDHHSAQAVSIRDRAWAAIVASKGVPEEMA